MEFRIDNLKEEEAEYIGEKINGIVPKEIDADSEEFVLKVENENGQVIGGCIAEERLSGRDAWHRQLYGETIL